jgi:hypothetical protein
MAREAQARLAGLLTRYTNDELGVVPRGCGR